MEDVTGYHIKPHDARTLYALREIERNATMEGLWLQAGLLNWWLDAHEDDNLDYTFTTQAMAPEEFYNVKPETLAELGISL
jgi:hypothetical protein